MLKWPTDLLSCGYISSISDPEIREGGSKLVNRYVFDLQPERAEELVQLMASLQAKLDKETLQASESNDLEEDENDNPELMLQFIYLFIYLLTIYIAQ